MSYLNDYLKVIPKADADIIRQNIADNTELFDVKRLTEDNYKRLVDDVIANDDIQTEPVELSNTITADDLNAFYSDVALDLHTFFPEQHHIEKLGENYHRIYQGHLEELEQEIEQLRESVDRLFQKEPLQENVITRSYSFEPDRKEEVAEHYTDDTSYLFTDRDGSPLGPTNQEKLFHTYHLTLDRTEEVDVLVNDKGITTARLDVVYESPDTLPNKNPAYDISKAIDGDTGTFWFNVAHKPDNSLDSVHIMPGRIKEEDRYVRHTTE